MRNMAVLHSPAFSYPLPVLVRVLSNLLIFKGKILYYNKDRKKSQATQDFVLKYTKKTCLYHRKLLTLHRFRVIAVKKSYLICYVVTINNLI